MDGEGEQQQQQTPMDLTTPRITPDMFVNWEGKHVRLCGRVSLPSPRSVPVVWLVWSRSRAPPLSERAHRSRRSMVGPRSSSQLTVAGSA